MMRTDVSGWSVRHDEATAARYVLSGAWRNETVAQAARALATRDPQRVTHVFDGEPCAIGELWRDAQYLAGALQARGLARGDVVSFQLPNWREAVVIDLAAALLGLVVAPIVTIYREAEAAFMLADCRAKAVFVPGVYRGYDYLGMMQRLAPQLPHLKVIVPVRVEAAGHFESLLREAREPTALPEVDPDSVKLIFYTSGTTGRPKGVLHSHNTMSHAVRRIMRHCGQGEGDTMLMASPLTHITGFGSGLELPLLTGLRTVFMERWDAAAGIDLIEREHATISMGATPFLTELLAEAERRGKRLPSLRHYACGGAAVPPALIYKAARVLERCRAFRAFGSSEVPLVTMGFVGPDQLPLAAETDGEIADYDVKIVDDNGRAVPVESEGEICARGAAMCLGYTDPAHTRESFDADGFFHTGDLGCVTAGHGLVISGRKKDLINRGGEKISAREVEDILHRHPAIEDAAVVAMPHARLGETVCAYVLLRPGSALTFEELVAYVAAQGVARQKAPERLVVADSLPRTASGKVRKDVLRADIRHRVATEVQSTTGIR